MREDESMRIALITGAGRKGGLGYEASRQLAEKGYHVILTARRLEQVEPLAQELVAQGLSASALRLDLTDDASVVAAARAVEAEHGRLDVLINNAVLMIPSGTIAQKDLEELSRELETNVVGPWRVAKHLFGLLAASDHARVVNVSSGAGSFWDPISGWSTTPAWPCRAPAMRRSPPMGSPRRRSTL